MKTSGGDRRWSVWGALLPAALLGWLALPSLAPGLSWAWPVGLAGAALAFGLLPAGRGVRVAEAGRWSPPTLARGGGGWGLLRSGVSLAIAGGWAGMAVLAVATGPAVVATMARLAWGILALCGLRALLEHWLDGRIAAAGERRWTAGWQAAMGCWSWLTALMVAFGLPGLVGGAAAWLEVAVAGAWLWGLAGGETVRGLATLPPRWWRLSPAWGWLVALLWLVVPGGDLAWLARHQRSVEIGTRPPGHGQPGSFVSTACTAWLDGAVLALAGDAERPAELLFYDADLREAGRCALPFDAYLLKTRGDWVFAFSPTRSSYLGVAVRRDGTGGFACLPLPADLRLLGLATPTAGTRTAFGWIGSPGAGTRRILRLDLSTGEWQEERIQAEFLAACQVDDEQLRWLTSTGDRAQVWRWRWGKEAERWHELEIPAGAWLCPSPDLSRLVVGAASGAVEVVDLPTRRRWAIPLLAMDESLAMFGGDWVGMKNSDSARWQLFRLPAAGGPLEMGRLPFPPEAISLAPDGRRLLAAAGTDNPLRFDAALIDLASGRHRRLVADRHLDMGAMTVALGTNWSGRHCFYTTNLPGRNGRYRLVRLTVGR